MRPDSSRIRLILELRRGGVTDTAVLGAIERTPRELFVPEAFVDQAYENVALPIGFGQTISQPLVVARMTQALKVGRRMKVLEIGTGSGYQAAVLARLCRRLYTIEQHRELMRAAEARFARLGLSNVTTLAGDGRQGWPPLAPFERIIVTAAAAEIPAALAGQLAEGGILVLPLGADPAEQSVVRVTRTAEGLGTERLFPVRFVPLAFAAAAVGERQG
ncbi:MAG: protein-L-isoaspartate(D-aspartate) O-methyltransferase [Proteobacteria bacterium]|nr:protein-L-isoaspartate(D-aspartate) O-methyltransferase [Pseudomonadota bacterium]